MSRPFVSRRHLLQALTVGAGAFLSPGFLRGKSIREAEAAMPSLAKRFVCIFAPNGIPEAGKDRARFQRNSYGVPDEYAFGVNVKSATAFDLGYYLQSFAPLKRKVTVLEGLNGAEKGDYHFGGFAEALTNNVRSVDNYIPHSGGPSIDQLLASRSGTKSLYLGQGTGSESICYGADGNGLSKENDPAIAFDGLFKNIASGSGVDPALARRITRRRSVLDAVARDLGSFKKNALPAEARQRADAQLDAVRSLELSLDALATATCAPGKRPAVPTDNGQTKALAEAQVQNIVAALACGLTNVAVLQFRSPTQNGQGGCNFDPVSSPAAWHDISHTPDDGCPQDNWETHLRLVRFYHDVAYGLAARLDAIPDGNGLTMLDNTIVLVCSEISSGHTADRLVHTLVGGGGLGIKTGQYLKFGDGSATGGGIGLGRSFVSIANALGFADVQTFGKVDEKRGNTALPGFHRSPVPGLAV